MKNVIVFLLSVFIYLTSSVSYAKNATDLLLKLNDCSEINNDDARLVCFDKLVRPNTKLPVEAVVPSIVNNKSLEQREVNDFAKEHLAKNKEKEEIASIVATVSKLDKLLRGQWVIYLENGQKWQQTDTASIRLKKDNKVYLKRGAMGAVYLYKENSHRSIKVKRLK